MTVTSFNGIALNALVRPLFSIHLGAYFSIGGHDVQSAQNVRLCFGKKLRVLSSTYDSKGKLPLIFKDVCG